jgi:hypothetical protein
LEYNVALNDLGHLVEIRHDIVSHVHNQPMTMVVPDAGIWGTAGIGGHNIDMSIKSECWLSVDVSAVTIVHLQLIGSRDLQPSVTGLAFRSE